MTDLFTDSTVQAVASLVVLAVVIAAGFYVVARYRDYTAQDQDADVDVLANLREMHLKGDISDQEFRTIKSITKRQQRPDIGTIESAASEEGPEHQSQTE